MERCKGQKTSATSRKHTLYALIKSEGGVTYVELAIALSLVVLLIPAVMSLSLLIESGTKQIVGRQQLMMESEAFLADLRNEVRQGRNFRLSKENWLEFDLSSGESVRYRLDKRRIIRSLRGADDVQFHGTTILLQDVYFFACTPDSNGVEIEVGLQNWESDLILKTYLRSRID